MIKLRLKFQGKLVREIPFDTEEEITLGRDETCGVHVDNIGVSRVHCRIRKVGPVYMLQDMKSNNGTFVRGERVNQWNLNHGDEFFIGKHSVEFEHTDQALFSYEGGEGDDDLGGRTMGVDADMMEMMQKRQASKLSGYLEARDSDGIIRKLPLIKNPTFIGKHDSCQILVSGFFTGQRHALIFHDEACFQIVALHPNKLVFLNGEPVELARLQHEDRISVAKQEFRFFFGSA